MLALREFFWGKWNGVPVSATATASAVVSLLVPGAGSGKMRLFPDNSEPALEEFWEIREEYLKRVFSVAEKDVPDATINEAISDISTDNAIREDIASIGKARQQAYVAARLAENRQELEAHAATIAKLTIQLSELTAIRQIDDEVIFLLLLTD